MTPKFNTPRALQIIFVVTTAILAFTWWINGMDQTWYYISNVFVLIAVFWAVTPKKQK